MRPLAGLLEAYLQWPQLKCTGGGLLSRGKTWTSPEASSCSLALFSLLHTRLLAFLSRSFSYEPLGLPQLPRPTHLPDALAFRPFACTAPTWQTLGPRLGSCSLLYLHFLSPVSGPAHSRCSMNIYWIMFQTHQELVPFFFFFCLLYSFQTVSNSVFLKPPH